MIFLEYEMTRSKGNLQRQRASELAKQKRDEARMDSTQNQPTTSEEPSEKMKKKLKKAYVKVDFF